MRGIYELDAALLPSYIAAIRGLARAGHSNARIGAQLKIKPNTVAYLRRRERIAGPGRWPHTRRPAASTRTPVISPED